jgi:hypothetical protein
MAAADEGALVHLLIPGLLDASIAVGGVDERWLPT